MKRIPLIVNVKDIKSTAFRQIGVFQSDEIVDQKQLQDGRILDDKEFKYTRACYGTLKRQSVIDDQPQLEFLKLMQVQKIRHRIYIAQVVQLLQQAIYNNMIDIHNTVDCQRSVLQFICERYSINPETNQAVLLQILGLLPRFHSSKQFLNDCKQLLSSTVYVLYTNEP